MPVHMVPRETFGGVVSQDAPPAARSTRPARLCPSCAPRQLAAGRAALFWSTNRRFSVLGVPVGGWVPGVERSEPPESQDCMRPSPDRQPPSAFCSTKCPFSMFGLPSGNPPRPPSRLLVTTTAAQAPRVPLRVQHTSQGTTIPCPSYRPRRRQFDPKNRPPAERGMRGKMTNV